MVKLPAAFNITDRKGKPRFRHTRSAASSNQQGHGKGAALEQLGPVAADFALRAEDKILKAKKIPALGELQG